MSDLIVRTFPIKLAAAGAGRIVEGVCVPYGVVCRVADPPDFEPYDELFRAPAFARSCRAPDRVPFKFRHGEELSDWIGRGVELEETDAGLRGAFRVVDGTLGDHTLSLVDEGIITGLSVGAEPIGRVKIENGVVIRDRCRLAEVSLVPIPAYDDARVTARRAQHPAELELTHRRDAELDARLRAVGIRLNV